MRWLRKNQVPWYFQPHCIRNSSCSKRSKEGAAQAPWAAGVSLTSARSNHQTTALLLSSINDTAVIFSVLFHQKQSSHVTGKKKNPHICFFWINREVFLYRHDVFKSQYCVACTITLNCSFSFPTFVATMMKL